VGVVRFTLIALAACTFSRPSPGAPSDGARSPDGKPIDTPAEHGSDARSDAASGSGFEKPITVQPGKVGGDVTDFPVWIALSGDADLEAHATDDHADVYFTDATGSAVAYEITSWDRPSGVLQAWVRAAQLTPATGQNPDPDLFYLRYGGSAGPLVSDGAAVFDNAFAAVWHLDTDTGSFADSTGQTTATPTGSLTIGGGELGNGLVLDGGYATFTNPIVGNGASTLSAWVLEATTSGAQYADAILVLGTNNTNQARWFYSMYAGGDSDIAAGLFGDDNTTSTSTTAGTWTRLDWVYGGAESPTSQLYKNGATIGTPRTLGAANTASGSGYLGFAPQAYSGGGTMNFEGTLDEVRIASTARTSQWIATEYENQSSPSTFYAVGSAQTP
jgi:biopolymer transport protein ExbB